VLSLFILTAGFFAYRSFAPSRQIESIAVLPLVNESGSADVEYLSDGISESLINSLSQLKQLKVVARTTAFAYKSRQSDPPEVGRKLGVDAVLTGKVKLLGDTLIVQTDLISVADGSQIWGAHYTRKLADLLSVQENISHEILARLQPKLSSEGKKQLAELYPVSSEAYQLDLKGRFFWNRRTEEGLRKGVGYFEQAISEDPKYALAYVWLADSYNVMGFYSFLPPKEAFPKAKAAARKALELNEELAEAHNSLAYATLYYDWDFAAAEKEFLRAIELKPNYPVAHQWYGNLLTAMGRWDEAIQEFKHAQELDPLSLVITAVPGWTYYYARQYDRAIEPCQKAIEMDRNYALSHNWLGQAYERKGMYERAISEFKEALSVSGGSPEISALLAHAYAVSGNKREAQVILDNLLELSKQRYVSPYHIATIYAGLGDKDRALKWLDTAYNDRQHVLVFLKHDARLDNLRDDVRFQDLLRKVGFPQ
jgi:TolB-like protein/Tfp pilus assembly protein PilF